MAKSLFLKHKRLLWAIVTVLLILAVLAINLLLPFWQSEGGLYIDLTPEGLYTVSARMETEMKSIEAHLASTDREITITFCAARDYLMGNYETRYVYVLAKKLSLMYPHIKLDMRDVLADPSCVDEFRTTSLSEIGWNDVIISTNSAYGKQYRIMNAAAFWSLEDNVKTNFNGEFKLASAFLSLAAFENAPLACFTVGHGERYYDPTNPSHKDNAELEAFADMLYALGLNIALVDLDKEEIPDDCVLLIMNGPTRDYDDGEAHKNEYSYVSSLEKIDRYLAEYEAFMVLKDPSAGELPALGGLLEEWGIRYRSDVVRDSSPAGALTVAGGASANSREYLIASYATETEGTIGYSMYQAIADRATAPKTVLESSSSIDMVWGDLGEKQMAYNVSRMVSGVFFSSRLTEGGLPTAGSYVGEGFGMRDLSVESPLTLAAISVETKMGKEVDYYSAYVFAVGTTKLISSAYLNNASFCNYDTVYSILRTISRTDRYADAGLGGLTLNSDRYGGKALWKDQLESSTVESIYADNDVQYKFTYHAFTDGARVAYTIVLFLLPVLVIPAVGVIVYNRRKYR